VGQSAVIAAGVPFFQNSSYLPLPWRSETDGDAPLGGTGRPVEIAEVFLGGRDKLGENDKVIVFSTVERGGEAITRVTPNRSRKAVRPIFAEHVKTGATIHSDEWPA
jgi:transposase